VGDHELSGGDFVNDPTLGFGVDLEADGLVVARMHDNTAPSRRFELTIRISGDDWASVLRMLGDYAQHVAEHGPKCDRVTGGYDSGAYVRVEERPDVTHDSYFEALDLYLSRERKQ
jgi:hypothetical protein